MQLRSGTAQGRRSSPRRVGSRGSTDGGLRGLTREPSVTAPCRWTETTPVARPPGDRVSLATIPPSNDSHALRGKDNIDRGTTGRNIISSAPQLDTKESKPTDAVPSG